MSNHLFTGYTQPEDYKRNARIATTGLRLAAGNGLAQFITNEIVNELSGIDNERRFYRAITARTEKATRLICDMNQAIDELQTETIKNYGAAR